MREFRRLLLSAAALFVISGAGAAHAQTVILRKVPAGGSIEVTVNSAPAASTKSEAGGDVILPIKMFEGAAKTETDTQVLVGLCENNLIRVALLERGHSVPPEEPGCARRDMGGVVEAYSEVAKRLGIMPESVQGENKGPVLVQ